MNESKTFRRLLALLTNAHSGSCGRVGRGDKVNLADLISLWNSLEIQKESKLAMFICLMCRHASHSVYQFIKLFMKNL